MSSVCGGQCDQDKPFAQVLQNVAKMLPHEISMSEMLCHYKSTHRNLCTNGIHDSIFEDFKSFYTKNSKPKILCEISFGLSWFVHYQLVPIVSSPNHLHGHCWVVRT